MPYPYQQGDPRYDGAAHREAIEAEAVPMIITPQNFQECRGLYGDQYLYDHGYARFVPCEVCGTEGRIIRQHVINPYDEVDCGVCPACGGAGDALVMTEAVTMDDLEQLSK